MISSSRGVSTAVLSTSATATTTAAKSVSTPKKDVTRKDPATPVTESPGGKWKHPQLDEIHRRQERTNFGDKNVQTIAYSIIMLMTMIFAHSLTKRYFPWTVSRDVRYWAGWAYFVCLAFPSTSIFLACLPLFRAKDDFSDLTLSSAQRKLVGLPPSSKPETPGTVYTTPPRYSRTPSYSGSAGSKKDFSNSPLFNNSASPSAGKGDGISSLNLSGLGSPYSPFSPAGSPLRQKAMNGARRSSLGSLGSPSPLGASMLGASTASSIFPGGSQSPSPSPATGKRSSVALNNKWLYEKGRRSSGTGLYGA